MDMQRIKDDIGIILASRRNEINTVCHAFTVIHAIETWAWTGMRRNKHGNYTSKTQYKGVI
jgi:hypothetical protein